MRMVLVRHGETAWNAEGRYQGHRDIPLSPVGEAQAHALQARLRDVAITHALASPLMRAQLTAQIALGPTRADRLKTDADLRELCHGQWEGCLASEVRQNDPERFHAWYTAPETVVMPGGGESLQKLQQRCWRGLTRVAQSLSAEDILLVVAHDGVNRAILCRILGLDLARFWRLRQAPATINVIEGPSMDQLSVVRLNDCGHHSPLFSEPIHQAI